MHHPLTSYPYTGIIIPIDVDYKILLMYYVFPMKGYNFRAYMSRQISAT